MNPSLPATDPRCPECGAPVHLNSASCRECGSRRGEQGWFRPESYDGIGLAEDDDFDYEEFVKEEFQEERPLGFLHQMTTRQRFWWLTGVLVILAFGWLAIRGGF